MPLIRAYRPRYVPRVKAHRVFPRKKRVTFAKKVKKVLNRSVETKVRESMTAYADLEAASQRIIALTEVNQGDDYQTRTGNVIEPLRIQARVCLKRTSALD